MLDAAQGGDGTESIRRRAVNQPRYVSIKEIMQRLDVSLMTVYNWREGSPTRRPLPALSEARGKRHRVKIKESDLIDFLREYYEPLLERWQTGKQEIDPNLIDFLSEHRPDLLDIVMKKPK